MKLNEYFDIILNEYIGMVDQGTINMDRLELAIAIMSNKEEARRLAHKITKMANPAEVKKALKLGKEHGNRMAYWFVQALKEKPKVKV